LAIGIAFNFSVVYNTDWGAIRVGGESKIEKRYLFIKEIERKHLF